MMNYIWRVIAMSQRKEREKNKINEIKLETRMHILSLEHKIKNLPWTTIKNPAIR